jgi:cytochrome c5
MSIEQDRAFFRTFSIVLIILAIFTITVYFLASGISSTQPKGEALQTAAMERIAPVGEVNTSEKVAAAANEPTAATEAAPAAEMAAADTGGANAGKATYDKICFACHANGIGGAPKFGDSAAWADRISKGAETLHNNAINGYTGEAGIMPPKGGMPSLSDDEIKAAVDYMIEAAGGGSAQAAPEPTTAPTAAATTTGGGGDLAKGKETFDAACFLCHASGVAGAPKLGDSAAWQTRSAQGVDVLYEHAINGFSGSTGIMPAKGGRADLSDQDVKAAVDWMLSKSG